MVHLSVRTLGAALALFVGLTVSSCGPTGTAEGAVTRPSSVPVVSYVARGDITSVVTAPVQAIAQVEFTVLTPVEGKVRYASGIKEGTVVEKNQVIGWQGSHEIRTPAAGVITDFPVADLTPVQQGIPAVTIKYQGFGVRGEVPLESAFMVNDSPQSARVQFPHGPDVDTCTPVPSVRPEATELDSSTTELDVATLTVTCLIKKSAGLTDGLPGRLGITIAREKDTLTVPITAVSGVVGRGKVALLQGETPVTTDVELGITDGINIEVISGLSEGDAVLLYGPTLTPEITNQ